MQVASLVFVMISMMQLQVSPQTLVSVGGLSGVSQSRLSEKPQIHACFSAVVGGWPQ
jgi:hypothetical protein